jgi:hypothetical protein
MLAEEMIGARHIAKNGSMEWLRSKDRSVDLGDNIDAPLYSLGKLLKARIRLSFDKRA